MSITYLDIVVKNPQKISRSSIEHFLVDSGAIYSVIPSSVLKKLQIKTTDKQKFTLANGEIIEKQVGNALFQFGGKLRSSPVVFGDEGIFLLGAVTLESLGVILDPINRELKPLPMLMM
jgi:clan AA aspartic protease